MALYLLYPDQGGNHSEQIMQDESFDAFWWPIGKDGQEKLLSYGKQFCICLKMRSAITSAPALIFSCSNDLIWHDNDEGYTLLFDKLFFHKGIWCNFEGIGLFTRGRPVSFDLDDENVKNLLLVFENVCGSVNSNYIFRDDLIRTYIFQIIHLSIKMHIQRIDIIKTPIRYVKLTKCGIDMYVRIKLGHKDQ